MREMNSESQENDWIDSFIEKWIPIHAKDEQVVKEAKVEARKEFKRNVRTEIERATREARLDEQKRTELWSDRGIVVKSEDNYGKPITVSQADRISQLSRD